MFNRLDYHNNMLTCLVHLLQYCFQGQFVHICNEIALKASFTMLFNSTCCIKMEYHFLYDCLLDIESVGPLCIAPSANGLVLVEKGGLTNSTCLIFIETTTQ